MDMDKSKKPRTPSIAADSGTGTDRNSAPDSSAANDRNSTLDGNGGTDGGTDRGTDRNSGTDSLTSTDSRSGSDKDHTRGTNAVTSNSAVKEPKPSEVIDIDSKHKRESPSTSGPKGTEEPGSDLGPGGTGW